MLRTQIGQLALILLLTQPAIASEDIDFRDYPESTRLSHSIIGKSCTTITTIKPKRIKVTKCDRASVTGLDEPGAFLYFRFLDEWGNGYLYITDRFKQFDTAEVRVLAKVIGNKVAAASSSAKGTCSVNMGVVKIACLLDSKEAKISSIVEAYD